MAQHKPFAQSQPLIHNFCQTSDNFRLRSTSISGLVQQWRQLQASLTTAHNSLTVGVRDSDSDGRERIADLGMKPKGDYAADKMIEECRDKQNVIELYNRLYDELESKEKRLNEECARLESKQRLINDVKQEMELKEVEIKAKCEALELKQVQVKEKCEALELIQGEIKEKYEAFDLKLKGINERQMLVEAREADMDRQCKEIQAKKKGLDKQSTRLGVKKKEVKESERALELKQKNLLGREKLIEERSLAIMAKERNFILSLESKEKEMEERCRVIKVNEERAMSEICRAVEWRLNQMNEGFDAMEREGNHGGTRALVGGLRGNEISDVNEGLRLTEKQVEECCISDELMDTQVNEYIGTQALIAEQINDSSDKLESRANHDLDLTCQLESGEAKEALLSCEDVQLEIHQIGDNGEVAEEHTVTCSFIGPEYELPRSDAYDIYDFRVISSSVEVYSEIQMLCNKMDVNGMRSYRLTEEHNLLHDKILNALRSAPDPAGLVLNISKSFFESGLDEVDNNTIRTRCIYLLEQLTKLSPSITPDVEDKAREFAAFWRQRLNGPKPLSMVHFGYLHFLAAFKLAKSYKGGLLLSFFKTSYLTAKLYPPEKNVDLCCALGVQDKIPDFVRSLIQRQKHLEAVKCISLLKMECDFPPVPLLEAYLELVKKKLDDKLNSKNLQGKVDATAIELSHLHGALTNIQRLKLELPLPTDYLSLRIKELEMKIKRMAVKSSRKHYALSTETPTVQLVKRPRMGTAHQYVFIRWLPPPHGWVLLNTDGASKGNPGQAGSGGIFRDETGNFLNAYFFSCGICSAMKAELLALLAGLARAKQLRIDNLLIHMDNKPCVQIINNDQLVSNNLKFVVKQCKVLINDDSWNVKLEHSYREANRASDWLANQGVYASTIPVFLDSPPLNLHPILHDDISGVAFPRLVAI